MRDLRVALACDFKRDETLGSSRVPLRLAKELERLGVVVSTLFSDDLPHVSQPRLEQASAPARMAVALRHRAKDADIVDVAGGDAWPYALYKRWLRPHQRVVARSNGLWYRALAVEPRPERSGPHQLASAIYQRQVLCRWERTSISLADLAVFGAGHDADDVVSAGWAPRDRVAVVAPGVDDFFESQIPLDQRRGIAFMGTMSYRKGTDIVCASMSSVLRQRADLELTLFGPGVPPEQVRKQFDPDVRGRIRIVEMLRPEELARQIGQYAVLLLPTRYEGFGLVVLEAMRAGLAVVVTPTGAGADVVRDGHNGLVVPMEDIGATTRAVQRLVDDPEFRCRLAHAGREEARGRSWSRTARELLSAYEAILARPPRASETA